MKKEIKHLNTSAVHERPQFIYKTMLSCCLKSSKKKRKKGDRKNRKNKKTRFAKTNKEKLVILSKCVVCDTEKLRFIKEQEASGLLKSLEIKTSLSKISLIDLLFFKSVKSMKQ